MAAEPEAVEGDRAEDTGERSGPVGVGLRMGVGVLVTLFGVAASAIGSVPGLVVGRDTAGGFALALVGSELGFVAVGVLFLVVTGRGVAYLNLDVPSGHRGWALVVGATVGLFLARSLAILRASQFGVAPAGSSVTQVDVPLPVLVAILLPAMVLVVGPAEELLFRGVLQTYLREIASAPVAIVGAGLLFGGIHLPTLVGASGVGVAVSLAVITLVGFAIGWLYEHTGSLPAAMFAHGVYNALIVASAYAFETLG